MPREPRAPTRWRTRVRKQPRLVRRSPSLGGTSTASYARRARRGLNSRFPKGGNMPKTTEVGPASELTPGTVKGAGPWAVGNSQGELFAVTRRCRHLYADLANGSID